MSSGPAWAAGAPGPAPQLAFDAAQQEATLVVPAPACPATNAGCEWMLFMNAPEVVNAPVIGEVTGTSGTLTIPYPSDFCGVIQADALIGTAPFVGGKAWSYRTGMRTTISTCTSGGGTTGSTGGGTTGSTGGGTTGSTGGGTTGSTGKSNPVLQSTSLPFTGNSSPTGGGQPGSGTTPSQLPFTGADLPPILFTALVSLVVGVLLTGADRRLLRMVARHPAVAEVPARGAERAANWLLGR